MALLYIGVFNIELFKDITYLSIQINQTNKAEIVRPIDYIYKLVSGLIFLFVEEVIETIISATYAFCLENRQVYLAMKYGKDAVSQVFIIIII